MGLTFEWDENKASTNAIRHGVTFDEARTVFDDDYSVTIADPIHSDDEDRLVTIGRSENRRILVIIHTDRGDNIRIISARVANKRETGWYNDQETDSEW